MQSGSKMANKFSDYGNTGCCTFWARTNETIPQRQSTCYAISCDFPAQIAYIAVHNRGVNMSGVEGHAKPLDQLNEHYNL